MSVTAQPMKKPRVCWIYDCILDALHRSQYCRLHQPNRDLRVICKCGVDVTDNTPEENLKHFKNCVN